ncbi:hypothetical protein PMI08_02097 [Brevibacillus sp. CF112]|nr:hypothetical protein PMI08_02097 [Brevibacillus sp. CF112]
MKRSPVRLGDYFVQRFQGNADFRCEELNRCGEPLLLCYLDSLVDTSESTRLLDRLAHPCSSPSFSSVTLTVLMT